MSPATKLVSVVGARPQFIKIAPLLRSLPHAAERGGRPIEHVIVHTGQHYDADMSDIFFDELAIPPATFNLGVGPGSHGSQTGQTLARLEEVLPGRTSSRRASIWPVWLPWLPGPTPRLNVAGGIASSSKKMSDMSAS